MILTTLPDSRAFSDGNGPGPPENTVIIADTRERYFYPDHRTPYLFVTNFLDRGEYVLNGRSIEVSERLFYLANPGDRIALRFSRAERLRTCLILFGKGFVEDCLEYLASSDRELLERVDVRCGKEVVFPNVPMELNGVVREKIAEICRSGPCRQELDDILFELVIEACRLNGQAAARVGRVTAVKHSTREELYRRLVMAREFMFDNLSRSLTVEEVAGAVFLNKFHFLSNFKEVYGTTPHRYLTELRLQKAMELLRTGRHTVKEVCFLVGFESAGSFSNLFKKRFKASPSAVFSQFSI